MLLRIFFFIAILAASLVVAFRFGLLEEFLQKRVPTETSDNKPLFPPTISPSLETDTTTIYETDTINTIELLETPTVASASQAITIRWYVDNDKIATISHTAVHFGPSSNPSPKLASDYPEKSAILKGSIPATFSAQIRIDREGLYYYRAHAIIDNLNVWSDEIAIEILDIATVSSTPR